MPVPIDQIVQEFLINGYAVFEGLIPPEKVDTLHAALMPMLENVQAANSREDMITETMPSSPST